MRDASDHILCAALGLQANSVNHDDRMVVMEHMAGSSDPAVSLCWIEAETSVALDAQEEWRGF